jgi:hypothetical protein
MDAHAAVAEAELIISGRADGPPCHRWVVAIARTKAELLRHAQYLQSKACSQEDEDVASVIRQLGETFDFPTP